MRPSPVLLCLLLGACGPYPRDVAGTLEAIERDGRMDIGFAGLGEQDRKAARQFIGRLEQATGARAHVVDGPAERLLGKVEDGELDLVIGEFREDTPWTASLTIVEPLRRRVDGSRVLELAPAAAHGESRWIALVEREIRDSLAERRP